MFRPLSDGCFLDATGLMPTVNVANGNNPQLRHVLVDEVEVQGRCLPGRGTCSTTVNTGVSHRGKSRLGRSRTFGVMKMTSQGTPLINRVSNLFLFRAQMLRFVNPLQKRRRTHA